MSSTLDLASIFCNLMPDTANSIMMSGQLKRELPPDSTVIEVVFDPYDYHQLAKLHNSLSTDFGLVGRRWGFIQSNSFGAGQDTVTNFRSNTWRVKYWFKHPYDAIVFRLKYPL